MANQEAGAFAEPQTSEALTKNPLKFNFTVLEEELSAEAVCLDACIFLWAGRRRRCDTMFFSLHERTVQISGELTLNNQIFLERTTTQLGRIFKNKQVSILNVNCHCFCS